MEISVLTEYGAEFSILKPFRRNMGFRVDIGLLFSRNTISETYFVISATNIFSELLASSVSKS